MKINFLLACKAIMFLFGMAYASDDNHTKERGQLIHDVALIFDGSHQIDKAVFDAVCTEKWTLDDGSNQICIGEDGVAEITGEITPKGVLRMNGLFFMGSDGELHACKYRSYNLSLKPSKYCVSRVNRSGAKWDLVPMKSYVRELQNVVSKYYKAEIKKIFSESLSDFKDTIDTLASVISLCATIEDNIIDNNSQDIFFLTKVLLKRLADKREEDISANSSSIRLLEEAVKDQDLSYSMEDIKKSFFAAMRDFYASTNTAD